ncbi:MAG: hypothetical protein IJ055_08920 [Oscillospiraceae bacterium]|nr:hypothetical protein [Oscillospiraceae bacterium]
MDEFDSAKETMLGSIIQNGLRDKIDFIELFHSIYAALKTHDFPEMLTTPSEQYKRGDYRTQSLEQLLADTHRKAQELHDLYALQFSHRTALDAEETHKNFLFQDHQFHSILSGNNRYITAVTDETRRINAIHFTQGKPDDKTQNLQVMLGKLRGFIGWFQGMVGILAINYRQCKNERRQAGEDEFTQEQAIRSVLAQFRLGSYETDYLTTQILMAARRQKNEQIAGSLFDRSVYEHGFRYYCFENDAMHDMQSQIMMCAFQNTPEKLLLRICERAKVIGISATATVPTVIGNFDLDYLRSRMQGAFCTLQGSEHARLAGAFHSSQSGYEHIRIHTQLLGAGEYSVQSWTGIFEDENLGSAVHEALERKVFKSENAPFYYHERYVRIAKVFKAFLQHRDIRSMLCLLTAHPRENSRYLDLKLLYDIFDALRYCFDKTFDTANNVVILRSGDLFEREKRVLLQRLGAGERFFVISTYQTLGAGQNLQYRIPPMLQGRLVCSNQLPPRQEKDFDAIYLDKPTNLFAGLERSWQEESFVKYLFQVEFLQEKGELSMADALAHIRKAFRCYMTGEIPREHVESVYDKQSIRMYATRAVIQAIGRLCRTNQKSPDIYIFADDRIADSLDLSVTEGRILNHEFLALVRAIENTQHRAPEPGSLESLAELTASRAARDLDHMLHDGWDERRMRKWEALRTLVLRHPTASGAQAACDPIFPNYYIQLPQKGNVLYYIQGEHLRRGSVSFLRTPVHAREDETGTRLPRLMQWQALHEHFIAKGYATQFVPNDYILSPPLWQRIYKGALGEVTGQFWFETVLGVTLEALSDPEVFELFDGKVPGKPVYVDFKNWEEGTQADWEPAVDKIRRKAAQCGCRCAVIANVLARRSYRIQRFEQGDTAFLIVPSLLRDDDGSIAIDREAADAIRACLSQDY